MFKEALPILLGGALFGWAAWSCALGWLSRTWPTVEGTILSSTLTHGFSRGGPHHDLSVSYSYQVEGTEYTGDTVDFAGATYTFASSGERHFALYPVGARVRVHYNPTTPHRSVLEPGFPLNMLLPLLMGGVFLTGGILGLTGHTTFLGWRL